MWRIGPVGVAVGAFPMTGAAPTGVLPSAPGASAVSESAKSAWRRRGPSRTWAGGPAHAVGRYAAADLGVHRAVERDAGHCGFSGFGLRTSSGVYAPPRRLRRPGQAAGGVEPADVSHVALELPDLFAHPRVAPVGGRVQALSTSSPCRAARRSADPAAWRRKRRTGWAGARPSRPGCGRDAAPRPGSPPRPGCPRSALPARSVSHARPSSPFRPAAPSGGVCPPPQPGDPTARSARAAAPSFCIRGS